MNFAEYGQWMGIAAVVFLLGILVVSRIVRNMETNKAKVQKGALIIAITVFLENIFFDQPINE